MKIIAILLIALLASGCMAVWRPMMDMGCMGAGWTGASGETE